MKPIKRAIALCWIMLVACFVVKLFGGNWFEVVCTNEHFLQVCKFIENNRIVYETISFVMYVVPTVFIVLSFSLVPNPSAKQVAAIVYVLIFLWSTTFVSLNLKLFLEPIAFIILPIGLNYAKSKDTNFKSVLKKTWYYGMVGYAMSFSFQLISLLTRNLGIKIISDDVVVTFIMLIDYYIMLLLYYLYVKLKIGECKNG